MKKIFISLLFIIFFSPSFADKPEYSNNVNENIMKYGWEVIDSKIVSNAKFTTEIITLSLNPKYWSLDWILKCSFVYEPDYIGKTICRLP